MEEVLIKTEVKMIISEEALLESEERSFEQLLEVGLVRFEHVRTLIVDDNGTEVDLGPDDLDMADVVKRYIK